jgi:hypothetical protein
MPSEFPELYDTDGTSAAIGGRRVGGDEDRQRQPTRPRNYFRSDRSLQRRSGHRACLRQRGAGQKRSLPKASGSIKHGPLLSEVEKNSPLRPPPLAG